MTLPHGRVETPAFMPVGTAGSVKAIPQHLLEQLDVLADTGAVLDRHRGLFDETPLRRASAFANMPMISAQVLKTLDVMTMGILYF